MKKLKSEADVRKLFRKALPPDHRARWVEPSAGSTLGLPDLFLKMRQGRAAWVELKFCPAPKDGKIRFKLEDAQVREIPLLVADGFPVVFAIGLPDRLVVASVTDDILSGVIDDANSKTQQNLMLPLSGFSDLIRLIDWFSSLSVRLSGVK